MTSGYLYNTIFLYSVIFFTIIVALNLASKNYSTIKRGTPNSLFALGLCVLYAIWIGIRPPTYEFGDTGNYALIFNMVKDGTIPPNLLSKDALWRTFTGWSAATMDVNLYLTIISVTYFTFTFLACKVLIKNNVLAAVLFMLGSFSFYSYGTNGIRNGVACSIVSLVIVLCCSGKKRNFIIAILLSYVALNIHKSTMLPLLSLFCSLYLVKSFKTAYMFWIFSIFISLIAGEYITSFFAELDFDSRLTYLTSEQSEDKFSHTGFRFDFLLYSMMPIVLGYYVVFKRKIQDKPYIILLNTYTIANAFWVMVIRANFSNRFAYLSWFMFPLVLAYPLFKLDIWGKDQGVVTSKIMLAQVGFTWFMATFL